jgi:ABC-2 type transport system permease protein
MREVYLFAVREIREKARSRGFLLTTVALPLVVILFGLVTEGLGTGPPEGVEIPSGVDEFGESIGYVDRADLISEIPEGLDAARIREFGSVDAAQAAVQAGEIAAFYLIPPDYRETGRVSRYSERLESNPSDRDDLEWLLVSNLLPDLDRAARMRARYPFNAQSLRSVTVSESGTQGASSDSIVPFFVGLIIMMPLFTSGGYLFQSLQQEKGSRVLEILLASIRPWQLLGGKVLGYGGLILLQYLIWGVLGGIAALVAGSQILGMLASIRPWQLLGGKVLGYGGLILLQYLIWGVLGGIAALVAGSHILGMLASVDLAGAELVWILPYALGGFLLYAGVMSGIGALAEDMESSRVWVFLITLPMLLPFYLGSTIAQAPGGPLAVALSLVPFSAPVAMMLRLTSTAVPTWEILLSLGLLLITGVGAVALMARIFRAQVLLSGGGLSLSKLWRAVTEAG